MKRRIKNIIGFVLMGTGYKYLEEAALSVLLVNIVFQFFFRINAKCKENIHFTSVVGNFEKIKYHKDKSTLTSFSVSGGCYIQAINGIEIGKNFLFAPGIKLISANHNPENRKEWISAAPIKIGNNVWLGTNVIVLPGVEIADNCIIGAGAVVTKSIKESGIYAGNPATRIK